MPDTALPDTTKPAARRRLIFLGCAAVLLSAALAVGVSHDPPGITPAFLASVAVVLALAAGLRTKRHYELLLLYSLVSLLGAVVLHNVFEAVAPAAGVPFLKAAGEFLGGAFFLVAIFLCPAGIIVGGVGIVAKMIRPGPRPR